MKCCLGLYFIYLRSSWNPRRGIYWDKTNHSFISTLIQFIIM